MRLTLLAAGLSLLAAPALASDAYRGDPTNDPNSVGKRIHAYQAENLCPAGLQPVTLGGVICCGVPNVPGHYVNRAGGVKRVYKARSAPAPRAYAPEGVKGVVIK